MVIYGSNMFEFSVSKDMRTKDIIKGYIKESGNRKGSETFMSNTNRPGTKN
jgi:hypothetical protein